MRRLLPLFVAAGTLFFAAFAIAAPPAATRTVTVFAAASLSDAFTELGRTLEQRTPGLMVRFNFAGSQALSAQLAQGATADVFASADERWMKDAVDRRLMADEPQLFARNRLVVVIPRTNPGRIRGLRDLTRDGLKIVLGADAVPVGRYSRVVLRNLSGDPAFGSDYASRVLRNVVSEEENVKSVVGKVQLGEADAGIAYRSDVTAAVARFIRVIEIPENANVLAAYPIGVVKNTRSPGDATAFVQLVLSDEGQAVLARRGLIPVRGSRP